MFSGEPREIEITDAPALDAALEGVVAGAGVFVLHAAEGEPFIGRSARCCEDVSSACWPRANGRPASSTCDTWCGGSSTGPWLRGSRSSLVLYDVARRYLPRRYLDFLKLRMPAYVRLMVANDGRAPRSRRSSDLAPDLYYGPFRTRLGAEDFEHAFLDLFQLRRCQEELEPAAEHPGCVYGEMNMCLRPCQLVVGNPEYRSEADRVADFLVSNGKHLLESAEHARDRLSTELQFEEAARQHKRTQKIAEVLKLRDETAREVSRLNGVAVLPSIVEESITLLFLIGGAWRKPETFAVPQNAQPTVSLDHRLRDLAGRLEAPEVPVRERQEHLALWTRWYFSSWRDGMWLSFDNPQQLPWRRLVNAISRTASGGRD